MIGKIKLLLVGGALAGTATFLYFMYGEHSFRPSEHPLIEKYQQLNDNVNELMLDMFGRETCSEDDLDLINEYVEELNKLNEEKHQWLQDTNIIPSSEQVLKDMDKAEMENYLKEFAEKKLFDPFAGSSEQQESINEDTNNETLSEEDIYSGRDIPSLPPLDDEEIPGSQPPEILPDNPIPELPPLPGEEESSEQSIPELPDIEAKPIPELPPLPGEEDEEIKEQLETIRKMIDLANQIQNTLNMLQKSCEEKTPENITKASCKKACENYVNRCLSLVPNINAAIRQDGYTSCIKECSQWSSDKKSCIEKAMSCEAFTDVCGL